VSRTFFEDVAVERVQETPAITVTEAHVAMYLGVTREPELATGAVPEILPLCLSVGLGWRTPEPPMVVLAFVGLEWQIVREVRVGDTVHIRSQISSKRPMRDAGLVVEDRALVDQRGEVVQQGKFTFLVAKRPKEAAA